MDEGKLDVVIRIAPVREHEEDGDRKEHQG
jgi:hypothetical protein